MERRTKAADFRGLKTLEDFDWSFNPAIQFVLADQFQELGMAQPVGDRFLQSDIQGLDQTGETELFQGVFKSAHGQFWVEG
jgi:hypothetical protein